VSAGEYRALMRLPNAVPQTPMGGLLPRLREPRNWSKTPARLSKARRRQSARWRSSKRSYAMSNRHRLHQALPIHSGRALLCTGFGNEVAEFVDVSQHLIEVLRRSVKRRRMGLPVEYFHRIFNGVCLLEQMRDGAPQFVCFGPARRHALDVGTKVIHFKVLTSRVQ
jgi:hypothetical protein